MKYLRTALKLVVLATLISLPIYINNLPGELSYEMSTGWSGDRQCGIDLDITKPRKNILDADIKGVPFMSSVDCKFLSTRVVHNDTAALYNTLIGTVVSITAITFATVRIVRGRTHSDGRNMRSGNAQNKSKHRG